MQVGLTDLLAAWLMAIGCAAGCLLASRTLLHWFQLESYQFPGYFRTLRRQGIRGLVPGVCLGLALGGLGLAEFLLRGVLPAWVRALFCCGGLILCGCLLYLHAKKQPAKKKLAATPRMKRLAAVCLILWTGILYLLASRAAVSPGAVWPRALFLLFPFLLPLMAALGGLLAWPIEKGISEMYFRDAQRILRERKDLIRIGITGSWGKTSVKFILGTLLQERFPTLVTPRSFNTPMGVTRVIRTMLEPGHRVFVAEMGARHVGDIKEMCRLVHPHMGLLTSVGPQHLDTFHTQERITKTKYELIDALPGDGCAFFSDDGGIVLGLWEKTEKKKYLAGMNLERDDVWAEELKVSPAGSSFLLCTKDGKTPCETELLGELNIRNIVLAASVCLHLGMTGREIARGIRKLRPVEHRLELKRNPGGITVLDDAFNSNIQGAEQAFRTLRDFPGRRIVVTPGMVELGAEEAEMNREFGRKMAPCCDSVILVGKKRGEAIRQGLEEAGFDGASVHSVSSLQEAQETLRTLARSGDTILFENDLPDNYSEEP